MFLPIIMQISHAVWQSQENIGKKAVLGKSPCASGKAILSKSFSRTRLWSADAIMLLWYSYPISWLDNYASQLVFRTALKLPVPKIEHNYGVIQ